MWSCIVKKKKNEPRQPVEPSSALYPLKGKVNKYAFLHFGKNLLADIGIPLKEEFEVVITKDENGDLVLKYPRG